VWDRLDLFERSDSTFDVMMAVGETAQNAYQGTIAAFNAAIQEVPGTAAATWLTWDRDHFRLSGNGVARIVPFRMVRIQVPFASMAEQGALVSAGQLVEVEDLEE
jgi:hypothetical protein